MRRSRPSDIKIKHLEDSSNEGEAIGPIALTSVTVAAVKANAAISDEQIEQLKRHIHAAKAERTRPSLPQTPLCRQTNQLETCFPA